VVFLIVPTVLLRRKCTEKIEIALKGKTENQSYFPLPDHNRVCFIDDEYYSSQPLLYFKPYSNDHEKIARLPYQGNLRKGEKGSQGFLS
jgi:hypothetical protein